MDAKEDVARKAREHGGWIERTIAGLSNENAAMKEAIVLTLQQLANFPKAGRIVKGNLRKFIEEGQPDDRP